MKTYIGIDLGSTTTKAVVLGEDGNVLGRGITNSRSNYDVACAVARSEALVDARFRLLEGLLAERVGEGEFTFDFPEILRRAFKLEQHLYLLGELQQTCLGHAAECGDPEATVGVVQALFERLHEEAPAQFTPDAKRRSDFFRDITGSRYMALAEELGDESGVPFERLLGLFDKSIIAVESRVPDVGLDETLRRSLVRALREGELSPEIQKIVDEAVREILDLHIVEAETVGTGYGRARLPFPSDCIRSEILCHGLGAHAIYPATRTVLDIGGQDTKAIQVDEHGIVTTFQMNDRCAAGCGRYLGYIADEMNLGLHELGPLALSATRTVRINSTCTVFAGAELRDRLAMGQRREDILAGLHRAIVMRAMSLLARSGGVHEELTFTGGVANNVAAVASLQDLVKDNFGERTINVSPESIYMGALGAAMFAQRKSNEEAKTREAVGGAV